MTLIYLSLFIYQSVTGPLLTLSLLHIPFSLNSSGTNKAYLQELKSALVLAIDAMIAQRTRLRSLSPGNLTERGDLTGGFDRARPALTRQSRQWELPPFIDTSETSMRGQNSITPVFVSPGTTGASQNSQSNELAQSNPQSNQAAAGALFFVSFIVVPVLMGVVVVLFT